MKHVILIAAVLTLNWPEPPFQTQEPAIDEQVCHKGLNAALAGRGLPILPATGFPRQKPALSGTCLYEADPLRAGFKPGWDCIIGFNC